MNARATNIVIALSLVLAFAGTSGSRSEVTSEGGGTVISKGKGKGGRRGTRAVNQGG